MAYGKIFKMAVAPDVRAAANQMEQFIDRRSAGRAGFSKAWDVFDQYIMDTFAAGLPYPVADAHADMSAWWNSASPSWAEEYGVYDISTSKLASYIGSPYIALVQIAAMGMLIDAREQGNKTLIDMSEFFSNSATMSLMCMDNALESTSGKRTYGLPDILPLNEGFTGYPFTHLVTGWLKNNFGVDLGAPPRGFKGILEESTKPVNTSGLGYSTSPMALGIISAPITKGTSMQDDVKNSASDNKAMIPTENTANEGLAEASRLKAQMETIAVSLKGLDPSLKSAIDGMLKAAGIGDVALLTEAVETASQSAGLIKLAEDKTSTVEAELISAKTRLAKLSSVASAPSGPVKVAGHGDIPDGDIVLKNAAVVFDIPKDAAKLFDFDIPCGEWDHPHPHVPAIDHDYVFDAEILVTMLIAIRKNQVPWLKGHTGTGKTTMIEQIYGRLNIPVFRVNLDSDISRGDLVGREVLTTDAAGKTITKFIDGVIPMAMQQPCCLLLDEIDASRPDLGFVLQRLTEGAGFMLLEDGGRTVEPHPYFRLAATANTNGRGDETGLYSGTRALGVALLNRFKPFIDVDYMTQSEEEALIADRVPGIPSDTAKRIASYASEHRKAFIASSVTLPNSPRDTIAMAWAFTDFHMFGPDRAMQMAFKYCVLAAADADDRQVLLGLAQRVFPDKVTKGLKA